MIKTITKIGNSKGLIFDNALLDEAHLKIGDQLNVKVHEGGTITLTQVKPELSPEEFNKTLKGVLKDYRGTLRKLA